MKPQMCKFIVALSLSALPTAAFADGLYKVSASISHAGHEFAAPELVARPGKAATVEVAGDEAYTLAITVEPLPNGSLKVSSALKSLHGDLAPVLTLEPGKPASVAVGDLSMTLTATPGGA
jgi:archaellum component FlaG (FlaF/FlaG flagellin family)